MKPDELRLYRTPCQSCRTMQKMSRSPTGPSVRFVFASLPTRMIVVKLGDGSLWINSPVAVLREKLDQISAIGHIRYLAAPRVSVRFVH